MDFKEFTTRAEQDIRAALEDASPGVGFGMNQVEKLQGESYTAITLTPEGTNIGMNLNLNQLYYGLNALSNNLIMVDRKKLKNPNGLILGTPGSGKSFSAKREITNAFLVSDDDIIVCDPEAEYTALVRKLEGQVMVADRKRITRDSFMRWLDTQDRYHILTAAEREKLEREEALEEATKETARQIRFRML